MHEVVAERERRGIGERRSTELPGSFAEQMERFMVEHYRRLYGIETSRPETSNPLVNIDGSVYVTESRVHQLTHWMRVNISRHAQTLDSSDFINDGSCTHMWVLDFIQDSSSNTSLYQYRCATCSRQIQASAFNERVQQPGIMTGGLAV